MREKFEDISHLIEAGELDKAQMELDATVCEDAEWYYLQSWVFYERSWYLDCKNYLEQACMLDPENQDYKNKLDNLLKQGLLQLDDKEQHTGDKRLNKTKRRSKRSVNEEALNEGCAQFCCECGCEFCCELPFSGC